MFKKFLDLIFPNVCGFCDRINENSLCQNCEDIIKKYKLNTIRDLKKDETKYFDFLFCALKYENIVRDKIIEFKFGEKSYLYKTLAKIIIKNKKIYSFMKLYDIIIPVPMYKKKEWARGYNQAKLIAKEIAKEIGLELHKNNLIKIKDVKVQSTLTKDERQKNVKGAFTIRNAEQLKDKKIILVDDIYTTGSTANECSRLLKQAGAKEILVITIAKD